MNQDEHFFKTYDLNISAVLVASDFPPDRIERQKNGKVLFFFKSCPAVKKIVENYWKQEIKLNPQKIFDGLKFIKTRIYSNY